MPAFGTVPAPVRGVTDIGVNSPDGYPSAYPPGPDTWWTGLHWQWEAKMPTAVTRATAIIVNPLTRMPWQIRGNDGTVIGPDDDSYPKWLVDPAANGRRSPSDFPQVERPTRFDLFSRWIRDALWAGLGILVLDHPEPTMGSVELMPWWALGKDSSGDWVLAMDDEAVHILKSGVLTSGRREGARVVTLRHALPGGVLGWHRSQMQLAARMGRYASETFDSGIPSGILATDQPMNQKQADATRTEWASKQQTRQIAVLGNGTKYQPIAISPVDAELVAMGRLSNESIAHAFELPAWYLDASTNTMTYSNAQWYRQDLVDGVLSSWSARIEETISGLLPWGTRMVIDFTQFTRPMGIQEGAGDGAAVPA